MGNLKRPTNKRKKANKFVAIGICAAIVIAIAFATTFFFINDSPEKSKVAGVSDEVYYQLVEWYFYMEKEGESRFGESDYEILDWMKEQSQWQKAEENLKNYPNHANPIALFPNPLYIEFIENAEQFSEKELELIRQLLQVSLRANMLDKDLFETELADLKKALKVKDSYNPYHN